MVFKNPAYGCSNRLAEGDGERDDRAKWQRKFERPGRKEC